MEWVRMMGKVRIMGKGKFRNAVYAWKVRMRGKDGRCRAMMGWVRMIGR